MEDSSSKRSAELLNSSWCFCIILMHLTFIPSCTPRALVCHDPDQATEQLELSGSSASSPPLLSSLNNSKVGVDLLNRKISNKAKMLTSKDIISAISVALVCDGHLCNCMHMWITVKMSITMCTRTECVHSIHVKHLMFG